MTSPVEQIKDRLPIEEVLGSYITLIPAGKQFKARCPFHSERTPSFSVSPDKGFYYCFGCGAKGDIFTFVQEFEGMDFNGALKMLAQRAGVEITARDRKADNLESVYSILEKTTQRYQNELKKNTHALSYLKNRGITDETISEFRIGYAPDEWRFVADTCTTQHDRTAAIRAGLIKHKDENVKRAGETVPAEEKPPFALDALHGAVYDRFRGRIMFPLTDTSGRIVGFSGRMFPEIDDAPKYLNGPETEVFHKSRILYGFDRAKFHIKRHNFAILVEGQMDLLMSHQNGFRNTIATSGTAVSEQSIEDTHANLVVLSRLTPHIFLAFDGDGAGQKALNRAAMVALGLGMNPRVVAVPSGTDPAEFLRTEGALRWKELLKSSKHFIMHQLGRIQTHDTSPHMLVRILRETVFPFLSRVASPIEQNLYSDAIGKELGIEPSEIVRELAQFSATQPNARALESREEKKEVGAISAKERFLAFIERYPEYKDIYREKLATVAFKDHVFGALEVSDGNAAELFAVVERDFGMLDDSERASAVEELYRKAVDEFLSKIHQQLSRDLRAAEATDDEGRAQSILETIVELNGLRDRIFSS